MLQDAGDLVAHSGLAVDEPEFDPILFDRMVLSERTRRAARRVVDAEERQLTPIPHPLSLAERLAVVRPPVPYRVDRWVVEGGHVLLVAQYKAGKTTLVGNLVRSLVDGDPFLGMAKVGPSPECGDLDFEMAERQIEDWLRDQNIRNANRVDLVTLRGAASSFDILQPERRREWAAELRSTGAKFAVVGLLASRHGRTRAR